MCTFVHVYLDADLLDHLAPLDLTPGLYSSLDCPILFWVSLLQHLDVLQG